MRIPGPSRKTGRDRVVTERQGESKNRQRERVECSRLNNDPQRGPVLIPKPVNM